MNDATLEIPLTPRTLVRATLGRELSRATDGPAAAGERVCFDLSTELARWIGYDACQALLARALTAARPAHAWLRWVRVERDGAGGPIHIDREAAVAEPGEIAPALEDVLVSFIEALGRFIGQELALRLAGNAWPGETGRPQGHGG